jgi:hypothetical protein
MKGSSKFILEKDGNWGKMGMEMDHGEGPSPKVCPKLRKNHSE